MVPSPNFVENISRWNYILMRCFLGTANRLWEIKIPKFLLVFAIV